jgi:hypothetical protein
MAALTFKGIIKIIGVNPYVLVSRKHARKIKTGWRKPLPVLVRVNDKPNEAWRINLMPVGDGDFYLYLHEQVRKASNTKVGDYVKVELCFNAEYRNGPMHPVPARFSKLLDENSAAKANWQKLPPSRQKEVLRYLANLKSDEAINRNIEKALNVLAGNEARFMGRTWQNGK